MASDARVQASLHPGVDAGSSRCRNGASLCQSSQNATVPAQFPLREKTLIVRQAGPAEGQGPVPNIQQRLFPASGSQSRGDQRALGRWVLPGGCARPGRTAAGRTGTTCTGPRAALTGHPTAPSPPPEAPATTSPRRGRDVTVAGQSRGALGPPPADPAASSPPPETRATTSRRRGRDVTVASKRGRAQASTCESGRLFFAPRD